LSKLSDKLLVLSRESKETIQRTKINISALLSEVVTEFDISAKSSNVDLKLSPIPKELIIEGDVFTLKQAISNVVDNAIRYNLPSGKVNISSKTENGKIVIQIQDSGIGISKSDQQHIFERFYRVDKSRSREQGGSGLGLAMVKKIVENHGGCVFVDSALDEGSIFTLSLPLYISD
jgi:signal transduction histidine kinase